MNSATGMGAMSAMIGMHAFFILLTTFIVSLFAVMVLMIVVRRVMLDRLGYRGRPMLAASVAIATLMLESVLVVIRSTSGRDWLSVPILMTMIAGGAIGWFLLRRG